jgi:ABC-type multidrug transport system ATPase subunit
MTTQSQNQTAQHVVLSLRVTGGFLAGAEMEFADGLNCLIGGRGAGKTTALVSSLRSRTHARSKGEFAAVSGDRRSRQSESWKRAAQDRTSHEDGYGLYGRP